VFSKDGAVYIDSLLAMEIIMNVFVKLDVILYILACCLVVWLMLSFFSHNINSILFAFDSKNA
jgi:hypothetical protein